MSHEAKDTHTSTHLELTCAYVLLPMVMLQRGTGKPSRDHQKRRGEAGTKRHAYRGNKPVEKPSGWDAGGPHRAQTFLNQSTTFASGSPLPALGRKASQQHAQSPPRARPGPEAVARTRAHEQAPARAHTRIRTSMRAGTHARAHAHTQAQGRRTKTEPQAKRPRHCRCLRTPRALPSVPGNPPRVVL